MTCLYCFLSSFFVPVAHFGCLSWSECEKKLLYVAEKIKNSAGGRDSGDPACIKVSNIHTDLSRNSLMLIDSSNKAVRVCDQDRSVYCEDWGEALTSKSVPVVCVVDLQRGDVRVLQGVPAEVSPGQVRAVNLTPTTSDTTDLWHEQKFNMF